jgi:hypothetical protein
MKVLYQLAAAKRWIRRVLLFLPLLLVVASTARPAFAGGPELVSAPEPQRLFGIGTALGGGFDVMSVTSPRGTASTLTPALMVGTLELQFFMPRGYSIDVSSPILNEILASQSVHGAVFQTDAFFNFNAGRGAFRLIAGPGLGFMVAGLPSKSGETQTAGWIRIPAEIGVEVLTPGRGFGFKVLGRPYVEVGFGSGNERGVGGGMLALMAFSWYATR